VGPVQDAEPTEPAPQRGRLRSIAVGTAIGFAVMVASSAIAFSIVALPLYTLASTEPGSGVDRSLIRKGLFNVALPFGVVAGVAVGIVVAIWYARGGRLPQDRTPLHE
jgi:riboflavin transporter FmnP